MFTDMQKYTSCEEPSAQEKTNITPYTTPQTVLPDDGYDYLYSVQIDGVTYKEDFNSAGGLTITISAVDPNT